MNIEVYGTQFINKGAELMLRTILQRLGRCIEDVHFIHELRPGAASLQQLIELGIQPSFIPFEVKSVRIPMLDFLFNRKLINAGFADRSKIHAVLDASGFAYGDQWGSAKTLQRYKYYKKLKSHGTRVILMPQAFGPFSTRSMKRAIRKLVSVSDLVFARDSSSFEYLMSSLTQELKKKVKISPDFTIGTEAILPKQRLPGNFFIVPNEKVIKMRSLSRQEYLNQLVNVVGAARVAGASPFFLVHGGDKDAEICASVNDLLQIKIPVVKEGNPLKVKGIIGSCDAGFSSRFHGIVNALSQSVPVMGIGWSHKYKELFASFGFYEGLIEHSDQITSTTAMLLGPEHHEVSLKIQRNGIEIKQQIDKMWSELRDLLNKGTDC